MNCQKTAGRGLWPLPRITVLAAALALPLSACDVDELLQVEDPDVATPGALQGRPALPALLAGALSDFQVAYSGSSGSEGQVTMSALFSDEFVHVETFPTRLEVDQRSIQPTNGTMDPIFRNLQRARAAAERAASGFVSFDPNTVGQAEALNIAGYSYILFGENYCSGVPFSTLTENGETVFGQPETTTQMFQRAVAKFDSTLAVATSARAGARTRADSASALQQQQLARVGRARALLNLNRPAEAAATVSATAVPTSFVYNIQHSDNSPRQNNGVFAFVQLGRRFAVSDPPAGGIPFEPNALPYRSDRDPRVLQTRPAGAAGVGFDGNPLFAQQKYTSRAANVILASGIEARLIEAEAALRTGNTANFLSILNALRSSPASYSGVTAPLSPLTDPGSAAGRENLLFKERAYWMWLTSHRMGDLRRLVRQYGRSQQAVFPSGAYYKGGTYGTDVSFPIPFSEQNNPSAKGGCLDQNA